MLPPFTARYLIGEEKDRRQMTEDRERKADDGRQHTDLLFTIFDFLFSIPLGATLFFCEINSPSSGNMGKILANFQPNAMIVARKNRKS